MAAIDTMKTSNPCHDYRFSWTIENFSKTPMTFEGPVFSPFPEKKKTFCFQVEFLEKNPTDDKSRLRVHLKTLHEYEESTFVGSNIELWRNDDTKAKQQRTEVKVINKITLLMDQVLDTDDDPKPSKYVLYCLKIYDDKLIIKGTLSFYAYDMTSNGCKDVTQLEVRDELVNDFKNLYLSGLSSDVTFSVGGMILSAHKLILSTRSPVFAKMFEQDMLEGNTNNVIIEDVEFDVFNCFLRFLYSGELEDKTWDTVYSLYSLADKYQVKGLRKTCSEILGESLAVNSVCSALLLSDLHADEGLKHKANYFIADNLEVLGTRDWGEVVISKPQLVESVMLFVKWYCSLRFITL